MALLTLPISFGDAADRITILEIKRARIGDPAACANVTAELDLISGPFFAAVPDTETFRALYARLKHVNEVLWQVEDTLRSYEDRGEFGSDFVALARQVYATNDERARIKRELNILLQSDLREEKSYGRPVSAPPP